MNASTKIVMAALSAVVLQAALAGTAQAQDGALYYDAQTATGDRTDNVPEGMAWGYFHTGALASDLTLTANDPIVIQMYDRDLGERYTGSTNDEVQLWMSDTDLTALAGESVRFEFFSVVPDELLDEAVDWFEGDFELEARVLQAPGSFTGAWSGASWSSSSQSLTGRANTFGGYPAADHVVTLYYVHPGEGFGGTTPSGDDVETLAEDGNKLVYGRSAASSYLTDSSTTENIWNNGGPSRGMSGFILVENTSDRDGLVVNLDFLDFMEDDSPNSLGNDDDVLGTGSSTAPADFNLGPGGTLVWRVSIDPEWETLDDAGDFLGADGDLEPYINFSVNGDPELPLVILPIEEMAAFAADIPPSTFVFAASEPPSPLPPPPVVSFSGAAASYTVDEDVVITCTVTDGGGGVVYESCPEVDAPAWAYPAGTTSISAFAADFYGQEGSDTVSFVVEVTYASLIAITERFVDHNGVENSLVQKLRAAERARTDGAQDGACQAFINQVEAQAGNHVPEDYAEVLIYWAGQLQLQ